MDIQIDEPVSIRGYISGGMGGWGSSTTPLHRLVRRRSDADVAACGATFRGKISVKPAGRDGRPPKAQAEKYGLCEKCWPTEAAS